jgi:hypothetical protein
MIQGVRRFDMEHGWSAENEEYYEVANAWCCDRNEVRGAK